MIISVFRFLVSCFLNLGTQKASDKAGKTSLRFERVLIVLASFYYKSRMLNFVYLFSRCSPSIGYEFTNENLQNVWWRQIYRGV